MLDTNEISLLQQMTNAQHIGKKISIPEKAHEWNMARNRMAAIFVSLEKKGYVSLRRAGKATRWVVLKTQDGRPYKAPQIVFENGIKIIKAPPGYAEGYRSFNTNYMAMDLI